MLKPIVYIMLAGCAFVTGCGTTRWKTVDEPVPFIGPNKMAISQSRQVRNLTTLMEPTGYRYEGRWSDGKRIKIRPLEIILEIEEYLLRTQYYTDLKKSNGWTSAYHEDFPTINSKVNEHRLYLVSLKPTVLLLLPIRYDRPPELPGSIFGIEDMLGTPRDSVLGFPGLIESIYSGTSIPYDHETLWCSPSVQGEPQALAKAGEASFKIEFEGFFMTLVQRDGILQAIRTK